MQPLLNVDINQMSIAERIQLAEDLWDSILETSEALPALSITEAQQQELDNRLKQYDRTPDEGASWQSIKERFNQ